LDLHGSLLWSGAFIGCGYLFSHELQRVAVYASHLGITLLILMILALGVYLEAKYLRRRRLLQELKVFFIVDEAQNLTPHEIKTIITRAGEGVKIAITGDIYQIDHPYLDSQSNGLSSLIEHFKGQRLYAHMNLEKGERSELAELASNLL
jgi:predicted ribonuclease YlaK